VFVKTGTLGFDVSARELLIGIGPEGGVSGIFGLDIVKPGAANRSPSRSSTSSARS
jgi:hypothetical protein